ncbi:MAG TPA: hypothetical protein VN736_10690 [Candidatus Limnocylindrales bacterium]|nr:hypothetical protein [Candidatus Limnocylindrales bacterium]
MERIRVIISWPSDVAEERRAVREAADSANRILKQLKGGREFEVVDWLSDVGPGLHSQGPQGKIDEVLSIETADIMIGIFWRRFGNPDAAGITGTEHELDRAYESYRLISKPDVWLYFNQEPFTPRTAEDAEQSAMVLRFKQKHRSDGLYRDYKTLTEFSFAVLTDLLQYGVRDIASSGVAGNEAKLLYNVASETNRIASEGLTEQCADIGIHFRWMGHHPSTLTLLQINVYFNTTITNSYSFPVGVTEAVLESSTGAEMARGRLIRDSNVLGPGVNSISTNRISFSDISLDPQLLANGTAMVRIKNLRCNAAAVNGLVIAMVIVEGDMPVVSDVPKAIVSIPGQALRFSLRVSSDLSELPAHGVLLSQAQAPQAKPILILRFTELFRGAFQRHFGSRRGTCLRSEFHGVPDGVQLYVGLTPTNSPGSARLVVGEADAESVRSPSKVLDGVPVAELTRASVGLEQLITAVWRVEESDQSGQEFDFPLFIEYVPMPEVNTPPLTTISILGTLAPNSYSGIFALAHAACASTKLPAPRYVALSAPVKAIEISL